MRYLRVDAKVKKYVILVLCRGAGCRFNIYREVAKDDSRELSKIRKQIRDHVKDSGHLVQGAFTDFVDYSRSEDLDENQNEDVPSDSNLHGAGMQLALGAGDSDEMEVRDRRVRSRRE